MIGKNDLINKEISGYQFVKFLGSGQFGQVYKVQKEGQYYAIKILDLRQTKDSPYLEQYFMQEISVMKKIKSKYVVQFIEVFKDKQCIYVVLEYCEGDLLGFLNSNKDLKESQILDIMYQIITGIYHIHDQGLIHRDMKLENVLVNYNPLQIKICDFGFAKQLDDMNASSNLNRKENNLTDTVLGTQYYMCKMIQMQHYFHIINIIFNQFFTYGTRNFEIGYCRIWIQGGYLVSRSYDVSTFIQKISVLGEKRLLII